MPVPSTSSSSSSFNTVALTPPASSSRRTKLTTSSTPSRPHNHNHSLQFYTHPTTLFTAISSFLLPSFFSSTSASLIVATTKNLSSLSSYLRSQNLSPDILTQRSQLRLLPAEPILAYITGFTSTPTSTPPPSWSPASVAHISKSRFLSWLEPLLTELHSKFPRLLVYGELVNILCEAGCHELAHDLEQAWEHALEARRENVQLMCGYNMASFAKSGMEDVFGRLCGAHGVVVPDLLRGGRGKEEKLELVVAMLQQREMRLRVEEERGREVEGVLEGLLKGMGVMGGIGEGGEMGVITGSRGGGVWANEKFLGLSGAEEKGKRWLERIAVADRGRVEETLGFKDGRKRRVEYKFLRPGREGVRVVGETLSRSDGGWIHTVVKTLQDTEDHDTDRAGPPGKRRRME